MFLRDIFKIALTAFGGPQVHFTIFQRKLVREKRYLTEEELMELNSLCQMLPGPSSTQTLTAIGFKLGGPVLAFLTLAVWILPATVIMTGLVLLLGYLGEKSFSLEFLRYLQPVALGFIVFAAIKFTQLFARKPVHWVLIIVSALIAIIIPSYSPIPAPYLFPIILLIGGVVSNYTNKDQLENTGKITNIRWGNFTLFLGVFFLAAILGAITKSKPILIFENTYRYGSLVFGGGTVLIPMMYEQFVQFKEYLTAEEFINGIGLMQAMPGPVFSISTYTAGMAMKDWGLAGQALGCLIGAVGIFLPGILFIFFIYPLWNQLKGYPPVKKAIEGINATSAGLVVAAAYLLFLPIGLGGDDINWVNILIALVTVLLLLFTIIPSPIIIILTVLAGVFL